MKSPDELLQFGDAAGPVADPVPEGELFAGRPALPASIKVTGHLSEHYLAAVLGLKQLDVRRCIVDTMGSPRDYTFHGSAHLLTVSGVRRLVKYFNLPVDVEEWQPPQGPSNRHTRPAPRWWAKESA